MIFSIFGRLFGSSGGESPPGESDGSTDDPLGGGFDDDLLGEPADDDLSGGEDLFGDDDPFESDSDDDLSMGPMDADTGAVSSELTDRVEELETDIGSLASTVNTVKSENEQIGDSLEDIEENIRKLLEVYEMVTQGVNPFVEDESLSDSFGSGGGGGFGEAGIFDSTPVEDEPMEADVAEADADAFLDESLLEDDPLDDDPFGDEFGDAPDDGAGGADEELSFDALKAEYDSGNVDWADDDAEGESTAGDPFDDGSPGTGDPFDDAGADSSEEHDVLDADPLDDGPAESSQDDALESSVTSKSASGSATPSDASGMGDDTTLTGARGLDHGADFDEIDATIGDVDDPAADGTAVWDDERPYLDAKPAEYEAELLAMNWVEYLIGEVGLDGAAQTIRYYRSIAWISDEVDAYLQTLLNGFEGGPDVVDPEPRSSLGVDHKRSLWWISQIAVPERTRVPFDEWADRESLPSIDGTDDAATDSAGGDASNPAVGADTRSIAGDEPTPGDDAGDDATAGDDPGDESAAGQKRDADDLDADAAVSDASAGEKPSTNDGQADADESMIWVDSDVVLPDDESDGTEVIEPVTGPTASIDDHDGPPARVESDGSGQEGVKPLVMTEEVPRLERWQVELIRSLFGTDDDRPTVGAEVRK